jgi:predicted DNA-binding WGR domain protein
MRNTSTAVAWTLTCPSVSGRKEYRVLVFDKYVVVGWGVMDRSMQYKAHTEHSAKAARDYALVLTTEKEKKGYTLYRGPLRSAFTADYWDANLPGYIPVRGGSPFFDSAFRGFFTGGIELTD